MYKPGSVLVKVLVSYIADESITTIDEATEEEFQHERLNAASR
jgi:hypothetical protein